MSDNFWNGFQNPNIGSSSPDPADDDGSKYFKNQYFKNGLDNPVAPIAPPAAPTPAPKVAAAPVASTPVATPTPSPVQKVVAPSPAATNPTAALNGNFLTNALNYVGSAASKLGNYLSQPDNPTGSDPYAEAKYSVTPPTQKQVAVTKAQNNYTPDTTDHNLKATAATNWNNVDLTAKPSALQNTFENSILGKTWNAAANSDIGQFLDRVSYTASNFMTGNQARNKGVVGPTAGDRKSVV